MNGVTEESVMQSFRSIKSKLATVLNAESQSKLTSIPQSKLKSVDEKAIHESDTSSPETTRFNGISDKAVDVTANSTPKSVVDSLSEVANTSSVANVVLVGSSATTVVKEPSQNSKLYVLNGNILKEVNDVDKVNADKVNYVCVSANNLGNVIKKIQGENAVLNGKSSGETDGDKKLLSTVPTFIQLSHPSLKTGSNPKIAFTVSPTIVTKPTNNHDILRSKLLENPALPASKVKGEKKALTVSTKEKPLVDSPAVAKARSELVRCRKALIEAAIHPQLPTYSPPPYYTGPTYTCEECEDTFASPEGLSNHKNRRSVLFSYACPVCKKTLEFYSRCMFLLHVRSHDVAVKACFLTISIIPANKLKFAVLDGELRNEVEAVPLFDPTTADRCSPTDDKPASPLNQIVPIYAKRKATSPIDQNAEVHSLDDDPPADKLDSSSTNDVPDPPGSIADEPVITIRSAKVRKKRSPPVLRTNAVLKPVVDRSTTYTTTNCTPTTATCSYSPNVEPSTSSTPVLCQVQPPAKSSAASAAATYDEIHLTSSDEDEPAAEESKLRIPCRECFQEVTSLTNHYRAQNRPLREYPCEQCKFFNPSACALAAHTRMHTRAVPHICPDCGFYFSTIESFLIHVKQVCFYDYKTIRFKCPECSLLKPSVPLFIEHLKRCHIREVFKCSVCITSSYSERIVQTHMERVHPEATPTVLEGYRCMLCPNVLVAKQSIHVHVKKHVFGLQHLRYVYICKFCKKYASGRMSKFEAHYRSCADRAMETSPSGKAAKKVSPGKSTVGRRSSELAAEKDPLSMEEWEADQLKAEYVPKTKWCVMCRTTKLNEHSKSLFCNACVSYVNADGDGTPTVTVTESVAGRSKRKLKCKLCKQLLNRDWSTITNHYLHDHHTDFDAGAGASKVKTEAGASKAKTPEGAAAKAKTLEGAAATKAKTQEGAAANKAKTPEGGTANAKTQEGTAAKAKTQEGSAAAKAKIQEGTVVRKRKSSVLKQESAAATSTSLSSSTTTTSCSSTPISATTVNVAPTKVPKVECKYRCVKCGFGTNVRNDFHEHIVSHKTQSNTNYQCLECGECFIVKPSLEKHLIVVHKVRDIGEYYKENRMVNGGSDEDVDHESKEKAVAENQCEVCYMQCNSKQQYDRHIRTHGMAFVAMQSRAKS